MKRADKIDWRSIDFFESGMREFSVGKAYMPNMRRIEINITDDCNLYCFNCNRSCRQAPSKENISLSQISKFVEESIVSGWKWESVNIFGGEPTLHPDLFAIVGLLDKYRKYNAQCGFSILTNGYGNDVGKILKKIPKWITVINSHKKTNVQKFISFNIAPVDIKKYKDNDLKKGCWATEICGLALTRHGFYMCGSGAGIDRVFGFDIGIKKLSLVTEKRLKKQFKMLCGYCGNFRFRDQRPSLSEYKKEIITTEQMSPSWIRAYAEYKKQRPRLTLY